MSDVISRTPYSHPEQDREKFLVQTLACARCKRQPTFAMICAINCNKYRQLCDRGPRRPCALTLDVHSVLYAGPLLPSAGVALGSTACRTGTAPTFSAGVDDPATQALFAINTD